MTVATLAPAASPEPDRPDDTLTVAYSAHDALVRAALAADAGGYPNPLGYLRDALGVSPRPGAHPREYVPCDPDGAVFGRW